LTPPPTDFGVLPGVTAALDAMDQEPSIVVALLTGNFERGAAIKLGHFGLWQRFRFGAFGDEHLDRRDLVPVALARAAEAGIVPTSVVVIGDTPLDVDCAQHHGAIAVAVATGQHDVASLTATGAHLVLPTLESLDVRNLPALAR
jgi:phosphoglycolate phosphatase-like HAD superfamily hydrolase